MDKLIPGQFEYEMLQAISMGGEVYGAGLASSVSKKLEHRRSPAQVYMCLKKLKERGLISTWRAEARPIKGGRARICYTLTEAGGIALAAGQLLWGTKKMKIELYSKDAGAKVCFEFDHPEVPPTEALAKLFAQAIRKLLKEHPWQDMPDLDTAVMWSLNAIMYQAAYETKDPKGFIAAFQGVINYS